MMDLTCWLEAFKARVEGKGEKQKEANNQKEEHFHSILPPSLRSFLSSSTKHTCTCQPHIMEKREEDRERQAQGAGATEHHVKETFGSMRQQFSENLLSITSFFFVR